MTIISNTAYLANYPNLVISPEVVELMQRCAKDFPGNPTHTIQLFECYCHVTDRHIELSTLRTASFTKIAEGFLGSLCDTWLVNMSTCGRRNHSHRFLHILKNIKVEIPEVEAIEKGGMDFETYARSLKSHEKTNKENERYWCGWGITSIKGVKSYLQHPQLWTTHGVVFCEKFYSQIKMYCEKHARPRLTEFNKLAKFLSLNPEKWSAKTFETSSGVENFFIDFMKYFFWDAYHNALDINTQIRVWRQFVKHCEEVFLNTGVWATPARGKLPRPEIKKGAGKNTRIRKDSNGVLVHEKLITHVPLQITDEEAIELLFKSINNDIGTIKKWAITEVDKLYKKVERRKQMALSGKPISGGSGSKTIEQVGVENICATFEKDGFHTGKKYLKSRFGTGTNLGDIADVLGLPKADALHPFQCLLVCEHPQITLSYLNNFLLYSPNGDRTGFVESEEFGAILIGYKDRRGPELSEQEIILTPRAAQIVRQLIEITEPLREALRKAGDDKWRELFLTCGRGFSYPSSAWPVSWNNSSFVYNPNNLLALHNQFFSHTPLRGDELTNFLTRVSLTSLRASCAVSIYLDTHSVQAMSEALGHARYTQELLAHYLPEAILSFFQTRWIRIFQRNFICLAMKDSPYLLQATNFSSMSELHEFLKNHVLKELPEHLKNPYPEELPPEGRVETSVFVSINPEILTSLISLEDAVDGSTNKKEVCATSIYWASVSKLIRQEISNGNDFLLKQHLNEALIHSAPNNMVRLIHESPT